MSASQRYYEHAVPAWRDRADFIIQAEIQSDDTEQKWEQLWVKRLADDRFLLCCIPFFLYDVALGDEVKATSDYVFESVVIDSGHYTFRVWFGESNDLAVQDEVLECLKALGCLFECYSANLIAIDADSDAVAQKLANFLYERDLRGRLSYETGRSKQLS